MKKVTFIYLYFFAGVLFLINAIAVHSTENSNLTPVYASIGFAIISISLVLFSRAKRCKKDRH